VSIRPAGWMLGQRRCRSRQVHRDIGPTRTLPESRDKSSGATSVAVNRSLSPRGVLALRWRAVAGEGATVCVQVVRLVQLPYLVAEGRVRTRFAPPRGRISLPHPVPDRLPNAAEPVELSARAHGLALVYVGNQYDRDRDDDFDGFSAPAAVRFPHRA
jgi:hypothetical protein